MPEDRSATDTDDSKEDIASDDDEWLEKAQKVREKLEEVKDEEDGGIEDGDGLGSGDDAPGTNGSESQGESVSTDDRREADIGVVKLIQQGHGPPELFLKMGEVEVLLYANFQLKEDGRAAVLQALDVEDMPDAFYGSSKTAHAGTRSVGFDASSESTPEAVERSLTAEFGVKPEVMEDVLDVDRMIVMPQVCR